MKRDVTIRALLQRERRLHPERHPAATAAVFGTSVHRWVKGSIRPGIATARARRATWRSTVDRLVTRRRD